MRNFFVRIIPNSSFPNSLIFPQLFRFFQPDKYVFLRGGKAAQHPALHGHGALEFAGQGKS